MDLGMCTKRFVSGLVVVALILLWAQQAAEGQVKTEGRNLRVLCSFFPICLFTRNVVGERRNIQVEMLLPADRGDPHDYVLTPRDVQRIARADLFIVNGLGLEEFLGAPVKRANPRVVVVDTSQGTTPIKTSGGEHQGGINPHLFASPRQAIVQVRNIEKALSQADPAGAPVYRRSATEYIARLERLQEEFLAASRSFGNRKIVTVHRIFDYLARDIGVEIIGVVRENPEQEPSAGEVLKLVRKMKSSGIAAVFTEPQYPSQMAQTVAREARVPVYMLDPVATGPENPPPDYYEAVMRRNLETLKSALGGM